MVQKRPFGDETYGVSSKHPRQLEYICQLSALEFVCAKDTAWKPKISGEGEGGFSNRDEKHVDGNITEHPICTEKDSETSFPGCISNTSWASSSTSEEDDESQAQFQLSFSPECYNSYQPRRTLGHPEKKCSSLLECPPRKLVSIGLDFQANLPEWGAKNARQASELDISDQNDVENKLAGICVIPMPEFGQSANDSDKVGGGRTDCCCEDSGSVRCVRQHIKEARARLCKTIGHERFSELGFSDMGEVVAYKWSREEQQLFHDVVYSNPASWGKNFWDHLSMVFPTRAKKDIVSYYFNVFMLQRRAVQNRCDPMNIDSDDDEWHGSDDSGDDDDVGTAEEDDDSVEFLAFQDAHGHNEILENDSYRYDDDSYNYESVGCDEGVIDDPKTYSRMFFDNGGPEPTLQLWDEEGDHDVQDDSCTSDDAGTEQVTQVNPKNSKCHLGSFSSVSGGEGDDFVLEHYDTEVWDVGYLTCRKNEVEFLPTCSVIEEVFGAGAWNYTARDGKDLS